MPQFEQVAEWEQVEWEVEWEKEADQAMQVEFTTKSVYPLVRVDIVYLHPVVMHSASVALHHSN